MTMEFTAAQELLQKQIMELDGWLVREAGAFTVYLMHEQVARDVSGTIYEIGVFRGKYFAALNLMRRKGEALVGIDSFAGHAREQQVQANFTSVFGDDQGIALHRADSSTLSVEDVRALLGGDDARFISIDGSHEAPNVAHDMQLAAGTLCEEGIVSVDDLLNPVAIGVSEGFYRYALAQGDTPELVPFAFCRNKAFLCRPSMHAAYFKATEIFLREHGDICPCNKQAGHLERDGAFFEQTLLGSRMLTLA